ncbi:MAG TPA: hypothetical protein VGL99_20135 [Chloroflexota bacterium]|jgi:hypothetical protein
MSFSTVLAHIVARIGAALWRHRLTWLTCLVVAAGVGVYSLGYAGPSSPAASLAANSDCADTAMGAVAKVDDQAAHAAYNCLAPTMRHGGEQEFVKSLHDRGDLPSGKVDRVGDKRQSDGSRIVFYTIEAGGQVVGYIVYLDANGKVEKIE